jgi:hypothetical protein
MSDDDLINGVARVMERKIRQAWNLERSMAEHRLSHDRLALRRLRRELDEEEEREVEELWSKLATEPKPKGPGVRQTSEATREAVEFREESPLAQKTKRGGGRTPDPLVVQAAKLARSWVLNGNYTNLTEAANDACDELKVTDENNRRRVRDMLKPSQWAESPKNRPPGES